ncbi:hypothetical protein GGX14DRAFT_667352 [Mycena pura]|uniref:Uncharacterized protein n=1 Tax=Mycena pura TaxID=153505 RepID=A0AAD6Y5Q2_9AGAR|nr:hypothetical protein GGX14DRAFT_667352 [Mycena pura]
MSPRCQPIQTRHYTCGAVPGTPRAAGADPLLATYGRLMFVTGSNRPQTRASAVTVSVYLVVVNADRRPAEATCSSNSDRLRLARRCFHNVVTHRGLPLETRIINVRKHMEIKKYVQGQAGSRKDTAKLCAGLGKRIIARCARNNSRAQPATPSFIGAACRRWSMRPLVPSGRQVSVAERKDNITYRPECTSSNATHLFANGTKTSQGELPLAGSESAGIVAFIRERLVDIDQHHPALDATEEGMSDLPTADDSLQSASYHELQTREESGDSLPPAEVGNMIRSRLDVLRRKQHRNSQLIEVLGAKIQLPGERIWGMESLVHGDRTCMSSTKKCKQDGEARQNAFGSGRVG